MEISFEQVRKTIDGLYTTESRRILARLRAETLSRQVGMQARSFVYHF